MNDVLTYLEETLAPFDEVPFNAVDSALLAQFCMARGEGIMPRVLGRGEEAAAAGEGDDGGTRGARRFRGFATLRAEWRRVREGGLRRSGKRGAVADGHEGSRSAVDGVGARATALEETLAEGEIAEGAVGEVAPTRGPDGRGSAAVSSAAVHDRVEALQMADAPASPVRFADLLRAELFPTMFSGMHAAQMKQQLFLMAASPRFRDLLLYDHAAAFDEELGLQFAATTFVCPGQFAYVGFRGTDTTLTGWREDFNMAYMVPVPAQDMAARYLAAVAADPRLPEAIILGGHSKGGNLAEYAALTAAPPVQARIAHLYSHDGPGFMVGTFSADDYAPLVGRMTKQVPEDSMVGILMESGMPTQVVSAAGRGFEQHSVYRWDVASGEGATAGEVPPASTAAGEASGEGVVAESAAAGEAPGESAVAESAAAEAAFVTLPGLPERTQRRAEALKRWLASMDGADRERMVDALFDAVRAAGITDAAQIFEGGREWAILRDGVMRAPAEDRTTMLNALRGLTRAFSDVTAERNHAHRDAQRKAKGSRVS